MSRTKGNYEHDTKVSQIRAAGGQLSAIHDEDIMLLQRCVSRRNLDNVDLLLSKFRTDIDSTTRPDGRDVTPTALMAATSNGPTYMVTALLHCKASPNTINNDGISPLISAAAKGQSAKAYELVLAGARPMENTKSRLESQNSFGSSSTMVGGDPELDALTAVKEARRNDHHKLAATLAAAALPPPFDGMPKSAWFWALGIVPNPRPPPYVHVPSWYPCTHSQHRALLTEVGPWLRMALPKAAAAADAVAVADVPITGNTANVVVKTVLQMISHMFTMTLEHPDVAELFFDGHVAPAAEAGLAMLRVADDHASASSNAANAGNADGGGEVVSVRKALEMIAAAKDLAAAAEACQRFATNQEAAYSRDAQVRKTRDDIYRAAADRDVDALKELVSTDLGSSALSMRASKRNKTLLLLAVENLQTEAIPHLIAAGSDLEAVDSATRQTALMLASKLGNVEIVRVLITAGADTEGADSKKRTPLMLASANGYDAVAERLIAAAVANGPEHCGPTLLWAAETENVAVVRQLLAAGCSTTATNDDGMTALMLASSNGNSTIVKLLASAGASLDEPVAARGDSNGYYGSAARAGMTALMFAAHYQHEGVVSTLVDLGAGVNLSDRCGSSPLLFWSENNTSKVSSRDVEPRSARSARTVKVASTLIAAGANLNHERHACKSTALMAWSRNTSNDNDHAALKDAVVNLFMAATMAKLDEYGGRTLIWAASISNTAAVKQLIDAGADLNATSAAYREFQVAQERGMSFSGGPNHECTALRIAAKREHQDVVDLLVDAGIADAKSYGADALLWASENSLPDVALKLLEAGASVHAKNKDEETALQIWTRAGHVMLVSKLIAAGADVTVRAAESATLIDIASKERDQKSSRHYRSDESEKKGNDAHTQVIDLLVAVSLAEPKKNGGAALLWALQEEEYALASQLIAGGADLNTTVTSRLWKDNDMFGKTPLMVASMPAPAPRAWKSELAAAAAAANLPEEMAEKTQKDVVNQLIKASVAEARKFGGHAMIWAAETGNCEVALQLIAADADMNVQATHKGQCGKTALAIAFNRSSYTCSTTALTASAGTSGPATIRKYDGDALTDALIGAALAKPGKYGRRAIEWACEEGNAEITGCLIAAGVPVNPAGSSSTPLIMSACIASKPASSQNRQYSWERKAVKKNERSKKGGGLEAYKDVIVMLLTAGSDPNAVVEDESSVLIRASEAGVADVVHQCIAHGADVNVIDPEHGSTALMFACESQNVECVMHLVEADGLNIDQINTRNGWTALMFAIRSGNVAVVDMVLDAGASVNVALPPPLYDDHLPTALGIASSLASRGLNAEAIVRRLISAGANVTISNESCRHLCRRSSSLTIKDFDSKCYCMSAVVQWTLQGNVDIVDLLVAAGIVQTSGGGKRMAAPPFLTMPLLAATLQGNAAMVERLLAAGADANSSKKDVYFGHTVLMIASEKGHAGIVDQLIAAGAKLNLQSSFKTSDEYYDGRYSSRIFPSRDKLRIRGMTALMLASKFERVHVALRLIAAGADVTIANNTDGDKRDRVCTPLLLWSGSVGADHPAVVPALLAAGADASSAALIEAAKHGRDDTVAVLLAAGARLAAYPCYKSQYRDYCSISRETAFAAACPSQPTAGHKLAAARLSAEYHVRNDMYWGVGVHWEKWVSSEQRQCIGAVFLVGEALYSAEEARADVDEARANARKATGPDACDLVAVGVGVGGQGWSGVVPSPSPSPSPSLVTAEQLAEPPTCLQNDGHQGGLPCLPTEMWTYVLQFVKISELGNEPEHMQHMDAADKSDLPWKWNVDSVGGVGVERICFDEGEDEC